MTIAVLTGEHSPGPQPESEAIIMRLGKVFAVVEPGSPEFQRLMEIAQAGEGPPGTEPWLRRALEIDPEIEINVHAGLYDSLNSCAGNEELVRRHSRYAANFHLRCFLSGHSLQMDPRVDLEAGSDLRAWIARVLADRQVDN